MEVFVCNVEVKFPIWGFVLTILNLGYPIGAAFLSVEFDVSICDEEFDVLGRGTEFIRKFWNDITIISTGIIFKKRI